ncbi:hypothetical protein CAEBREN_08433 [Caenorhabditis brenneri]|uniref:Uncharacterized protein n=1 Tax=Caenorhabditis brenneri TaxID=135651 RepID=G0N126_CAEBE|nr:hypothetical protein CAEBREN_08433 [Caenorhabditis brenneri]
MSCYKIMVLLAIVDILSIIIDCLITGFLTYQGAVFCTYPEFIYVAGSCEHPNFLSIGYDLCCQPIGVYGICRYELYKCPVMGHYDGTIQLAVGKCCTSIHLFEVQ